MLGGPREEWKMSEEQEATSNGANGPPAQTASNLNDESALRSAFGTKEPLDPLKGPGTSACLVKVVPFDPQKTIDRIQSDYLRVDTTPERGDSQSCFTAKHIDDSVEALGKLRKYAAHKGVDVRLDLLGAPYQSKYAGNITAIARASAHLSDIANRIGCRIPYALGNTSTKPVEPSEPPTANGVRESGRSATQPFTQNAQRGAMTICKGGSANVAPDANTAPNVFVQRGKVWFVRFNGIDLHPLDDKKFVKYAHYLITNRPRHFKAHELAGPRGTARKVARDVYDSGMTQENNKRDRDRLCGNLEDWKAHLKRKAETIPAFADFAQHIDSSINVLKGEFSYDPRDQIVWVTDNSAATVEVVRARSPA